MDVEKNINEANRQLSDKRNCKKFQEDPMLQHSKLLLIQLTDLKKKNNKQKNWLMDWNLSTQKLQNFTFRSRHLKKATQEDQL